MTMTEIDVRDIIDSIINNKKRNYSVNLNEFKTIYRIVSEKLSDRMVYLFHLEKSVHAIFHVAPKTRIVIKEDSFIKRQDILKFIDKNRAYCDLIEEEISFSSFIQKELKDKKNIVWMVIFLLYYLPMQLFINNSEIVRLIMQSMLIFISIFFSVFLSFITMYGIETAKKLPYISLYYEYMANSRQILILVLIGVIFNIFSLISLNFSFTVGLISSSFSIVLIIFFIRSIIDYYFEHAKFTSYVEIMEREFKNRHDEFSKRFQKQA